MSPLILPVPINDTQANVVPGFSLFCVEPGYSPALQLHQSRLYAVSPAPRSNPTSLVSP